MAYFTTNGHRLFYREHGNGPLLLILHGNTASSAHHVGELAYFGQRYRTVALDFHGCGQSERVEVWPDDWWVQAGRDAVALVTHLGVDHAILMGTSGGAIAALWAAILAPERVQVVIADSCVERQMESYAYRLVDDRLRFTSDQIRFWRDGHGDDWEQVVRADTAMWQRWLKAGGDWFSGQLTRIKRPVLFTNSLADDIAPDVGQQVCGMAMKIKGSQVFFTTEGGHPLMWSRPDAFRRAVDCFLSAPLD